MTEDEIVSYVISSARIEGQTLTPEMVDFIRRIAGDNMGAEEIRSMKRDLVERLRNKAGTERLATDLNRIEGIEGDETLELIADLLREKVLTVADANKLTLDHVREPKNS